MVNPSLSRRQTHFVPELFKTSGWDTAANTLSQELGFDSSFGYCSLEATRVAFVQDTLYVDGGFVRVQDGTVVEGTNEPQSSVVLNNHLIKINMSKKFAWNRPTITASKKLDEKIPVTGWGATFTFPSKNKFYTYGGYYLGGREPQTTTNGNAILWSYSPDASSGWTQETSNGDIVSDHWNGDYTTDPNENVGYYLGGRVEPQSSPGSVRLNQRLLLALKLDGTEWMRMEVPQNVAYLQHPFMEYLPFGKRGVLLVMGGLKVEEARMDNPPSTLPPLNEVYIYDIESGKWFTQSTSAGRPGFPNGRTRGCSAVFVAPDKSSYKIYIYGGNHVNADSDNLVGNTEIWALSLPSFSWIRVSSGNMNGIRRHSCFAHGKYLLSVSGIVSQTLKPEKPLCHELLQAWDTVEGKWVSGSNSIETGTNFELPKSIRDEIGGDSNGGATKRVPEEGWGDGVEDIFGKVENTTLILPQASLISVSSPSSSESTASDNTETTSTSLSSGAIAGIAIGAVAGVAILCALFFVIHRRKRQNQISSGSGPVPDYSYINNGEPNELHGYAIPVATGYEIKNMDNPMTVPPFHSVPEMTGSDAASELPTGHNKRVEPYEL